MNLLAGVNWYSRSDKVVGIIGKVNKDISQLKISVHDLLLIDFLKASHKLLKY